MIRAMMVFLSALVGTLPITVVAQETYRPATFDTSETLPLTDQHYAQACGPIAVYSAFRIVGVERDLDDIALSCGWSSGKAVSLDTLLRVMEETDGVRCAAVQITPMELTEWLSDQGHAAILALDGGEDEIGHAVAAYSADNGTIKVIGYPELQQRVPVAELASKWDGSALLPDASSEANVLNQGSTWWWGLPAGGAVVGAVAGLLVRRPLT